MTREEYNQLRKQKAIEKQEEYLKHPNYCECGCGQIVGLGKKRINGHNNIGKKRSEESKSKMASSQFNNHNKLGWRKHPHVDKFCLNCGKKLEGKQQKYCSNHCKNVQISTNREWTDEMRKNSRISTINWINVHKNYGVRVVPGWSLKACEIFSKFDDEAKTSGQYAIKGGEFYIEELGYWVDYINHDKKIIIEYDESFHYKDGQLREQDIRRQKEIQKHFSDYNFFRIRESNLTEDYNLLMDLIQ